MTPFGIHNNFFFLYEAFLVFHSNQGAQGQLLQPSNQQLDTVFGTHKDIDVVTHILKFGKEQHGGTISSSGTLNIARGSVSMDRSKGLTGI
jgi:hypothetical protein